MAYKATTVEQAGLPEVAEGVPSSESGRVTPYARGLGPNVAAPEDEMYLLASETAAALGLPVAEVLTQISFETGGTMNPMQPGPTTQHGQHRGLIQWGEPQAKQYGVDFSSPEAALRSQLGKDGAIVKYALDRGFKPGTHSGLDLYSTINAGRPGLYNASDANNGGAPGSVADKYNNQMGAHRQKVYAKLGMEAPAWFDTSGGQDGGPVGDKGAIPDKELTPGQKRAGVFANLMDDLTESPAELDIKPQTNTQVQEIPMMAIPEHQEMWRNER